MSHRQELQLRVLVANERPDRLQELVGVVQELGHHSVGREIDVDQVGEAARELAPDIAVVGLHDHRADHALKMISEIVAEAICPVIAITEGEDPDFVRAAAHSGIFAYATSADPDALRGAIDVAMRRFGQNEQLEGALARRAVIERAKGVLMERYSLGERAAFDMLRDQSRRSGEKVVVVSQALLNAHPLLREPPSSVPND